MTRQAEDQARALSKEILVRIMYDAWPHTVTSQALNELTGLPYGATIPFEKAKACGADFVAFERYAVAILAALSPVATDGAAVIERDELTGLPLAEALANERRAHDATQSAWNKLFYGKARALTPSPVSNQPIDMLLFCPRCHEQHFDTPDLQPVPHDDGSASLWDNPPHRSHLCHACGGIWRPADVATNGVAAIQTKGKADNWDGASPVSTCDGEGLMEVVRRFARLERRVLADLSTAHKGRDQGASSEMRSDDRDDYAEAEAAFAAAREALAALPTPLADSRSEDREAIARIVGTRVFSDAWWWKTAFDDDSDETAAGLRNDDLEVADAIISLRQNPVSSNNVGEEG